VKIAVHGRVEVSHGPRASPSKVVHTPSTSTSVGSGGTAT
jgi:hypothetical protein